MKRFVLFVLCLWTPLLTACHTSQAASDVPIAQLTDYQVVDVQGNLAAQVEEVLLDADSGQISYVVVILERGPFRYGRVASLETAVPRTAVPWDYFLLDPASRQLRLQTDKTVLYAAPLLLDEPNELQSDWDADILAYWQIHPLLGTQE